MASTKKIVTIALVATIILIGTAVVIYVFRCSLFKNLGSCVEDPNKSNTPVPAGSPSNKWVFESAPYNVGMYGPSIKALQSALEITADGKFGSQTKAAVIAKGYAVPLSQADYNKIVGASTGTGSGSPAPANPGNIVGQHVYSNQIVNIRSTPDVNDGWFNNKVCELPANYEPAPTILEVKDCSKVGTGCVHLNNYYWYKIQFKIANCGSTTGWVRQDVVTVK